MDFGFQLGVGSRRSQTEETSEEDPETSTRLEFTTEQGDLIVTEASTETYIEYITKE